MKRTYSLSSGFDLSIEITIDTEKMPEALAHEINNFWNGAEDLLSLCDDDVYQAVARRAASRVMRHLMDEDSPDAALEYLSEQEGWPDVRGMIDIGTYDTPSFASDDWQLDSRKDDAS